MKIKQLEFANSPVLRFVFMFLLVQLLPFYLFAQDGGPGPPPDPGGGPGGGDPAVGGGAPVGNGLWILISAALVYLIIQYFQLIRFCLNRLFFVQKIN